MLLKKGQCQVINGGSGDKRYFGRIKFGKSNQGVDITIGLW